MADRDRDDCDGFQPVGVVNGVRRVRGSMRCARRMHGVCAPLRPNLYSFSGTRKQLIIGAVSHVKFALTLSQPFLWILKWRPGSHGCQQPIEFNGTGWHGMGKRTYRSSCVGAVDAYSCNPQSPWQRGSNANTNGLLRRYIPKGTDLSVHSHAYLNKVARQL